MTEKKQYQAPDAKLILIDQDVIVASAVEVIAEHDNAYVPFSFE